MAGYGAGQGFAQGVQSMAGMILPAMQQKRQEKLYRDRLAFGMGWDGTPLSGEDSGSGPVTGVKTDGSGTPYQVTRETAPSSFMGRMFQRRSGLEYGSPPMPMSMPTSGESLARVRPPSVLPNMPGPMPMPQGPVARPPLIKQAPTFGEPMYRQPYMRMDEDVPAESRMRRTLGISRY